MPSGRAGRGRPPPPTADQNAQLIRARLLATIIRQVETVDARLRAAGAEADEKDARILAHLARTLGMVIDMGSGGTTSNHAEPAGRGDDVDRRLAERIKRWARGEQGY